MRHRYTLALGLLLGAAGAHAQTPATEPVLAQTASGGPAAPATTPADVEAYVRTATATKGGELDFDKLLATKKQTMFLHDGNMYNKREYALVLWGMRVKALGLTSAEQACSLYSSASRRALSPAEKQALLNGFGTPE
jgi:hypothetical protein